MNTRTIGQLAGALALTIGLAGCMDVTMDIEILNETNGKTTTTMVMGADFYAMAKAGMAAPTTTTEGQTAPTPANDGFCKEENAVLTENPDGSATCTMTEEGAFADIADSDDGADAKFEVVSPGVVKVSFSTAEMKGELGAEAQDEQTKAMMQALFEGHFVTIRIKGKEITESNMTISADKTSAEIVIPFLDLMSGTAVLPPELFATVKTN